MKNQNKNRNGCKGANGNKGGKAEKQKTFVKKTLEDHVFYMGTANQASDFKTTCSYVINYICVEFKRGRDIADALEDLKYPDTNTWFPTLLVSLNVDEDAKVWEKKQFENRHNMEVNNMLKCIDLYEDNKDKAYALLWDCCTTLLQAKLKQCKDFKTKIYQDPVELLKPIKEHSLNYQVD